MALLGTLLGVLLGALLETWIHSGSHAGLWNSCCRQEEEGEEEESKRDWLKEDKSGEFGGHAAGELQDSWNKRGSFSRPVPLIRGRPTGWIRVLSRSAEL